MGMGGGGTGSYSLQNHEHSDALLDGGALDENTTKVGVDTLLAWITSKRQGYELIESWVVDGSAPTSHNFNHDFDTDNYVKYSLVGNFATGAAAALLAYLGVVNNWYTSGSRVGGISDTYIHLTAQTNMQLVSSAMNAGTYITAVEFNFHYTNERATRPFCGYSESTHGNNQSKETVAHIKNADIVAPTTLNISLSASSFLANSEFSLFGVLQ